LQQKESSNKFQWLMKIMRCWNCGFYNSDPEYKFCGNCGAERKIICPACGCATLPDLQFCGNCGYDLDGTAYEAFEEYKKYYGDPNDNLNFLKESFGGLSTESYILVVTEKSMNIPFKISPAIINKSFEITKNITHEPDKAKLLFDYITQTIQYGESKRGAHGYRDAIEVFFQHEGVCGEMAILFVSMARLSGLIANYVSVRKDYKGDDVHHACAAANLNGKQILVDLSYYTFDIKHQDYRILSDAQFIEIFRGWDG